MKLKPPTLLRGRKARALAGTAIAMVGFAGLAIAQTVPASADPSVVTVAAGSDTVQDVYNQFARDDAGNALGSYDAVNPVTQVPGEAITPAEGNFGVSCSFFRPNGSGGGIAALRESVSQKNTHTDSAISGLTQAPAGTTNAAPQGGCVDIARSSKSVTTDGHQSNTGPIVWIPFAVDAVAASTGGTTTGPAGGDSYRGTAFTDEATVITNADAFTLVDLSNLFHNCLTTTVGGHVYSPNLPGSTGAHAGTVADPTPIHLYIPQASSGTASFWVSTLGPAGACVTNTVDATAGGLPAANAALGGVSIEEHNGFAVAADPNGFFPFSIAQWIAQSNAVSNGGTVLTTDRRHGALVHSLTNCSGFTIANPATGDCSVHTTGGVSYGVPIATGATPPKGGTLNTGFPITREVYSVVEFARVTTPGDPLYGLLNANSPQDFLCNEQIAIANYGFGQAADCGQVLTTNRSLG